MMVTMFTKTGCSACGVLKSLLGGLRVKIEEINLDKRENKHFITEMGIKSVPVVKMENGEIIEGVQSCEFWMKKFNFR